MQKKASFSILENIKFNTSAPLAELGSFVAAKIGLKVRYLE
jgi:hypothetical protein